MEPRTTRQRTAILQALQASRRPLNPPEVLNLARAAVPGLNLSTVYRQLGALLAEGRVDKVTLPGDSARYEAPCALVSASRRPSPAGQGSGGHHHHHFLCSACDRAFPIHACPGPMAHLAPQGFQVDAHDLTLYGRCGDCLGAADAE